MYKILLALGVLLLASACKPRFIGIFSEAHENQLRITYVNVAEQREYTLESISPSRTEMYSMAAFSAPVEGVQQNIRPVYPFVDRSGLPEAEVVQFLMINFTQLMPAQAVEPISGQSYGQLYTYTDRERYVSDFFTPGRVFSDPSELEIAMQIGTLWVSTRLNDMTAPCELMIEKADLFTSDDGLRKVYVQGRFQASLLVANQNAHVAEGTLRYRVTDGRFSFVRVVDGI